MRTTLAILTLMIWVQTGCDGHPGNGEPSGRPAATTTKAETVITDVRQLLADFHDQIKNAKDADAEADAIGRCMGSYFQYKREHLQGERAGYLNHGMRVTEQRSGRNVTFNVQEAEEPVEATIFFTVDTRPFYEMHFVPKNKLNLLIFKKG